MSCHFFNVFGFQPCAAFDDNLFMQLKFFHSRFANRYMDMKKKNGTELTILSLYNEERGLLNYFNQKCL
jgi:hypothetical protein